MSWVSFVLSSSCYCLHKQTFSQLCICNCVNTVGTHSSEGNGIGRLLLTALRLINSWKGNWIIGFFANHFIIKNMLSIPALSSFAFSLKSLCTLIFLELTSIKKYFSTEVISLHLRFKLVIQYLS